jgi:hypothetical protein
MKHPAEKRPRQTSLQTSHSFRNYLGEGENAVHDIFTFLAPVAYTWQLSHQSRQAGHNFFE